MVDHFGDKVPTQGGGYILTSWKKYATSNEELQCATGCYVDPKDLRESCELPEILRLLDQAGTPTLTAFVRKLYGQRGVKCRRLCFAREKRRCREAGKKNNQAHFVMYAKERARRVSALKSLLLWYNAKTACEAASAARVQAISARSAANVFKQLAVNAAHRALTE